MTSGAALGLSSPHCGDVSVLDRNYEAQKSHTAPRAMKPIGISETSWTGLKSERGRRGAKETSIGQPRNTVGSRSYLSAQHEYAQNHSFVRAHVVGRLSILNAVLPLLLPAWGHSFQIWRTAFQTLRPSGPI